MCCGMALRGPMALADSEYRARRSNGPMKHGPSVGARRTRGERRSAASSRDQEGREAQREPGNRQGRVTGALLVAA